MTQVLLSVGEGALVAVTTVPVGEVLAQHGLVVRIRESLLLQDIVGDLFLFSLVLAVDLAGRGELAVVAPVLLQLGLGVGEGAPLSLEAAIARQDLGTHGSLVRLVQVDALGRHGRIFPSQGLVFALLDVPARPHRGSAGVGRPVLVFPAFLLEDRVFPELGPVSTAAIAAGPAAGALAEGTVAPFSEPVQVLHRVRHVLNELYLYPIDSLGMI